MDHKIKLEHLSLNIANILGKANLDSERIYLKADRKINGTWKLTFHFLEGKNEIEIEVFSKNTETDEEPRCRMCGKSVESEMVDGLYPATCFKCLDAAWKDKK